tara:strand:- start:30623 stop:31024 length:402 start_codon:yes stop_codon:yes gene_type:complete
MAYTAVATWDLAADTYPVRARVRRRGVRTPSDGPMVQRRQTFCSESAQGQAAVRQFVLSFREASKADYNRAMALWKLSTGGSQGLNYSTTNEAYSGTEALIVRMMGAPLLLRQLGHGRYAFIVVLEEMLDAPG